MTVELTPYTEDRREETTERIARFFGYHTALLNGGKPDFGNLTAAEETLAEWITEPSALYLILYDSISAGFLRLSYRGSNVAWIEDIYVDPPCRNRGIASAAIGKAEEMIRSDPAYTAVCMDVVPRNDAALRLYHKLGYDSLSIVTVRKEFAENKRDRETTLSDLKFKY